MLGGHSPREAVEDLAAVLIAAPVLHLTTDHHEVDRSLVRAIHVEVDLAGRIDATDVAGKEASKLALRNCHRLLLFRVGKKGIPLSLSDPGHEELAPLGRKVGHRILDAGPVDPIIHLGLGDFKRHGVFYAGSRRDSADDHLVVTQLVGTGDVRLACEGFSDVRHAFYYTSPERLSTPVFVFFFNRRKCLSIKDLGRRGRARRSGLTLLITRGYMQAGRAGHISSCETNLS